MLMNFSPANTKNNPIFLTQDETDILVETAKLEREENNYATFYKSELLSADSTSEL